MAIIGLLIVSYLDYSQALNDGITGTPDLLVYKLAPLLSSSSPSVEPSMAAAGMFPLTDMDIKLMGQYLTVVFAVVACVFSFIAERKGEAPRPYAAAVMASGAALFQVNFILAAAVMFVTAGLIFLYRTQNKNKQKQLQGE